MYVTALLMLLLLICLLVSEKQNYKGPFAYDKATTLPLRGLLALLILSHHLGQRTDIYLISNFTAGIGLQIVAVFFFISGYGLCISYVNKKDTYLIGFLSKRLGKLLPKFIFLTAGIMLFYHFFTSFDIKSQIIELFSGHTPLPHSWFIYAIIFVYVAFYLCATISKSPKHTGILFTLSVLAYILIMRELIHFPAFWYMTILSVCLGYFVALYETKLNGILNNKMLYIPILAALLFVSFCATAKIRLVSVSFLLTEFWLLVQAFSVYIIIRTLSFFQWNWLCKVGVFSLELYLVHGIPLMLGQYLGLEDWLLWLFTYALSIPAAIILNRGYDLMFKNRKVVGT